MKNNWSVSRDQVLNTCERQYYFNYVVSARINSRDSKLKEIAFLKKLTNIPMWQGNIFHTVVANSLQRIKRGESLLAKTWLTSLKNKVEQEWAFSESRSFRSNPHLIDKDGGLALFEHEYDAEVEGKNSKNILQFLELLVNRFTNWAEQTDLMKAVQGAKQIWIEPNIYGSHAPGFIIDNVQVIAKVDIAFVTLENKFKIFDWKTGTSSLIPSGRTSQAEFQMRVYQLWPHLTLKYPLESIEAHLIYFGSDSVKHETFKIDMEQREYTLSLIRRSIARVMRFNNDGELKLTIEDFDFANSVRACQECKFKKLCQRLLEV
ncbi:MAG: PD-(D/E)XK nuclease family protein [Nostoc sp. CmiVER01]|uniref:PD-(D/E)XK nuclease family protein n=1 Tax=Nostoc sp. CmiVER01 TaxID=3075384 RepID=UPI002AD2ADCD|nr:PD-(D/E)XK nuclease family protein [Nostoc sp. CmiVER01]MDZ8123243.1 PD-(D/E)XK nuclease family protein [Nostoc sp. CmiVER01]